MQIVRTTLYKKALKKLKASKQEIEALEQEIASNPLAGDVIPGLGGIRKIRFGMAGKGKKGGGRVIYYLMVAKDIALMIFAYAKADQEDLSNNQKKAIKTFVEELEDGQQENE
ncbi:hypothetical protein GF108_11075 [Phyllobacterium sp. SYP-B3895]|uniref:type II toxin-antitoxin system RelE/ParE family toxin n=1 Tax=Phyllobacterium sp. SYP-B3895 TaxID=2663240 RepID=UPI001299DF6A|nr:type II toxin-antitoxin system RelE/ParE family toxin [Phyllobacterium sp. SYP-B3895]MRG56120.1 hypothetical protein [Phyllobacterium sp. SYP-B3895]